MQALFITLLFYKVASNDKTLLLLKFILYDCPLATAAFESCFILDDFVVGEMVVIDVTPDNIGVVACGLTIADTPFCMMLKDIFVAFVMVSVALLCSEITTANKLNINNLFIIFTR